MAGSRYMGDDVSCMALANKRSFGDEIICSQSDYWSEVTVFSAPDVGVDCRCVGLDFFLK